MRPSAGRFHCFGCQEGGDVISFVMKIDHLTFAETVERLAARTASPLRYEEGGPATDRQPGQRTRLVEAHKAAARVLRRAAGDPRGRRRAAVPGRARLRPGRGRALRGRLRPARLGQPHQHLLGRGFTTEELITGRPVPRAASAAADRPVPGPAALADPRHHRRRGRLRRAPAVRRRPDRGQVPQHPGDADLQEVDTCSTASTWPRRRSPASMQAVVVEGYTDVMACHLAGVEHRGRHLRHRVRRRPHQDPAPAADGPERVPRRGRLHLRRRLGRAEGRAQGVPGRPEVRHPDLRRGRAQRHGPVRAAPAQGRPGGARPGRPPGAAVRVRHPQPRSRASTWTPPRAAPRRPAAGMEVVRQIRDVSLRHAATRASLAGWLGLADPDELVARCPRRRRRRRPPARPSSAAAGPRRARTRATRRCGSSATRSRSCCRRRALADRLRRARRVGVHRTGVRRVCALPWSRPAASRPPATAARSGSRRSTAPRPTTAYAGWRASSRSSRCPSDEQALTALRHRGAGAARGARRDPSRSPR